jgi:hypothetical protein
VLPEPDQDDVLRYVEEDLCAFLDVEDFEKDVVTRFTGDFAVLMSHQSDVWLSQASGRPAPTTSFVLRFKTDPRLAERLPFALKGIAGSLRDDTRRLSVVVAEEAVPEHPAYRLQVMRVRRPGLAKPPGAGYFIVPDAAAPGHSLLVVSTSVEWLHRAVLAREQTGLSLGDQGWFRHLVEPVPAGKSVFSFGRGDLLARALARSGMTPPPGNGRAGDVGAWMDLFGAVGMAGRIDDGVIRADVWVSGQRLRPTGN